MSENALIHNIEGRLAGLQELTHRRSMALGVFQYTRLPAPCSLPWLPCDLPASIPVEPDTGWGEWRANFALNGHFCRPADWPATVINPIINWKVNHDVTNATY